jgi:hypothetical protein
LGLKFGWKYDLKQLQVFAVPKLPMTDFRGLMHTRPRLQSHAALALVFEFNLALEHIHQLKAGPVKMRLARKLASGRANDVRDDATLSCTLDSQITVLEERQKAALEMCIAGVGYNEASCSHGFSSGEGEGIEEDSAVYVM